MQDCHVHSRPYFLQGNWYKGGFIGHGSGTPLHTAVSTGSLELVDVLLGHGADPYAQQDDVSSSVSFNSRACVNLPWRLLACLTVYKVGEQLVLVGSRSTKTTLKF